MWIKLHLFMLEENTLPSKSYFSFYLCQTVKLLLTRAYTAHAAFPLKKNPFTKEGRGDERSWG